MYRKHDYGNVAVNILTEAYSEPRRVLFDRVLKTPLIKSRFYKVYMMRRRN